MNLNTPNVSSVQRPILRASHETPKRPKLKQVEDEMVMDLSADQSHDEHNEYIDDFYDDEIDFGATLNCDLAKLKEVKSAHLIANDSMGGSSFTPRRDADFNANGSIGEDSPFMNRHEADFDKENEGPTSIFLDKEDSIIVYLFMPKFFFSNI